MANKVYTVHCTLHVKPDMSSAIPGETILIVAADETKALALARSIYAKKYEGKWTGDVLICKHGAVVNLLFLAQDAGPIQYYDQKGALKIVSLQEVIKALKLEPET